MIRADNKSTIYIFYDDNQNIYDINEELPVSSLISTTDIKDHVFNLTTNLRNTKNIHQYAITQINLEREIRSLEIEGIEPVEYKFTNSKEIIKKIGKVLKKTIVNNGIDNKNVMILSNRSYENSVFSGNKDVSGYKLVKTGEGRRENTVKFRTISEYKGLESDVVLLVLDKREKQISKELLYVGITRAKHLLYCFVLE